MAEAILFNLAASIIKTLSSSVLQQDKQCSCVKDELEKLKITVQTIQAVVLHAEELYFQSPEVKVWVDSLKQVFYDADDLLDEISMKASQKQMMTGHNMVKEVRLFFSSSNQLAYIIRMGYKIKDVRSKLDVIANNRKFHLDERHENISFVAEEREQSHSSLPAVVIGRENDKNIIIEFLLSSSHRESVSIISIVGLGGLGKTTLAQSVFNDERVQKSNFELKSDKFSVKKIVRNILESAGGKPVGSYEMDTLKNLLHKKINGRKYLLVLDDVWNLESKKWFDLMDLLVGGASGSRIIVTTRFENVAIMTRSNLYKLEGLSKNESWSLFKEMAFRKNELPSSDFELVGKKIVKKCAGVPMVIITLGRLLYSKEISKWRSFKDKELPNIDLENDNNILSFLRLSYNHLPSHLKCCFRYCSLFPKGHKFYVRNLVCQWVAQGFIESSNDLEQDFEAMGLKHFKELLWRLFFQEPKEGVVGDIITCKMHDLMYDLAVLVAGEESSFLNSDVYCGNEETRHVSIYYSSQKLEGVLLNAKKLRTFFLFNQLRQKVINEEELDAIFSNFKRLRALDLGELGIKRVPPSIEKLKHIRYLNLSYNKKIEMLPDSITKLQNLETLKLSKCRRLKQLPENFKMLVHLRQLYNEGCVSLTHMPRGLGQLTSLGHLSTFIVAEDNGVSEKSGGLDELHDLNKLRGILQIHNLRYVKNGASELEAANLKQKPYLQTLQLAWKLGRNDYSIDSKPNEFHNDNKEISIEELQPHPSLKWLLVYGYGRVKFPSWVSLLTNFVNLRIDNCISCKRFPPLDQFPFLKELTIDHLIDLEYIKWADNQISGSKLFFPSLEKLWLLYCPNLKGWWRLDELLHFHCLNILVIESCPNIISMPLVPCVESLELISASVKSLEDILKMKISVSKSPSSLSLSPVVSPLKTLRIENIEDIELLTEELIQNFTSLQNLALVDCPKITTLPPALRHLTSLENLFVWNCDELDFSDDIMQWECLKSLEEIQIDNMLKLVDLPKGLQCVPTLRYLYIKNCPNMMCLPDWMPKLTALKYLDIENCPQLSERFSRNIEVEYHKIAYITHIWIDGESWRL